MKPNGSGKDVGGETTNTSRAFKREIELAAHSAQIGQIRMFGLPTVIKRIKGSSDSTIERKLLLYVMRFPGWNDDRQRPVPGWLLQEVIKAFKADDRQFFIDLGEALKKGHPFEQPTEVEWFLVRYWVGDLKIGEVKFPPLCTFSVEGLCEIIQAIINPHNLKDDGLRKIIGRNLRLRLVSRKFKTRSAYVSKLVHYLNSNPQLVSDFAKGIKRGMLDRP